MIRYDRLWETMAEKGMSQYRLIKTYGFSAGQIGRMKKNMHVSTRTLDTLCTILQCSVSDILEFVPSSEEASAPLLPSEPAMEPAKEEKEPTPKGEKPKKSGKGKKREKKSSKGKKK